MWLALSYFLAILTLATYKQVYKYPDINTYVTIRPNLTWLSDTFTRYRESLISFVLFFPHHLLFQTLKALKNRKFIKTTAIQQLSRKFRSSEKTVVFCSTDTLTVSSFLANKELRQLRLLCEGSVVTIFCRPRNNL